MPRAGNQQEATGHGFESPAQAAEVLGVASGASPEEVRKAYLRAVAAHPPDRAPAQFERVRDAYRMLSDARLRHEHVLQGPDPSAPLTTLLACAAPSRAFVGPGPWLAALAQRARATIPRPSCDSSKPEHEGS